MHVKSEIEDCRLLQDYSLVTVLLALIRNGGLFSVVIKGYNDLSGGRHFFPQAMWIPRLIRTPPSLRQSG